ncbi:DUF6882 domain-containing protein [Bacterioplanoides sp.]|uniref:DUF6882 domain-containing protein n=1 Tax=Bacterioplanoides sp. TaxID=2066072 RepID=UPI003B5B82FA
MWSDDQIDSYVDLCMDQMEKAQEKLQTEFNFGSFERFDFDIPNRALIFSSSGQPQLKCEICFICSTQESSGSLQWAWGNKSLPEDLTSDSLGLKILSEESGLEIFSLPVWEASEQEGWEMASIALNRLGGIGVYRCPAGDSNLFVLIKSVAHC